MQPIQVKYKKSKDGFVGIPVQQWYIENEDGESCLRMFVVIPILEGKPYCFVRAVLQEDHEWVLGNEMPNGFGITPIEKNQLPDLTKELKEDIHYVWDGGVCEHRDRASRIYRELEVEIATCQDQVERLSERREGRLLESAKEKGYDAVSYISPNGDGVVFGEVVYACDK